MQVELSIIKHLLNKDNYNNYSSFINVKDFPDELRIVWNALCSIHSSCDESPTLMDVANVVFSSNPKDSDYYKQVFNNLEVYQPIESTVVKLIESLKRRNVLQKVSLAAYEEAEGLSKSSVTGCREKSSGTLVIAARSCSVYPSGCLPSASSYAAKLTF